MISAYDKALFAELRAKNAEALMRGEVAREARALDALEPAIRGAVLNRLERTVATRSIPAVEALLEMYGRTPRAQRTA